MPMSATHSRLRDFAHPYHSWERGLNKNSMAFYANTSPRGKQHQSRKDEDHSGNVPLELAT